MKKALKYIGIIVGILLVAFVSLLVWGILIVGGVLEPPPTKMSFRIVLAPDLERDITSQNKGERIAVSSWSNHNRVSNNMIYEQIASETESDSSNLWINKVGLSSFFISFFSEGSDESVPAIEVNQRRIKISVNGEKVSKDLDENGERKAEINYSGKGEETYVIEMSWGSFKRKSTLYLHWLESDEFEKLKEQKLLEFQNE